MRARERAMASRLLTAQEQARRAETFLHTTCAELAQMCRHTRERDWDVVTHYIEQRTLLAEQVGHADQRGGPGAGRCAGGMGTQATHAHLHGIECVERLGLNPLMRALVWLLEWLPAKTAEWLNMVPGR